MAPDNLHSYLLAFSSGARDVLEKFEAPLAHLIRNAVDHGLETAADRHRVGKVAVGTIITTQADRLILCRRAIDPGYGKWVFPGGYVDRGEPLTIAAIREAREECGLDIRIDGLVNIYSYAGRVPVIVVYAATAVGGTLTMDDESLEMKEFERDSIPWTELAFRSTEEGLRDYLAGLLHPVRT